MFLGICHCQKSVGLGTWNSPSLENQEWQDLLQTYKQGTNYEAQQDMCYSSKDALGNQTHRKKDRN